MFEALAQAMSEYAQAIRGDWSDFDGRSERNVIESWVDEIHVLESRIKTENAPTPMTIKQWRDQLGICPDGNGHWAGFRWGHCHQEDCPISYAREYPND